MLEDYIKKTEPEYYPPVENLLDLIYKHYTEKDWKNPENYDICINSDTLGVEKTADLICEMVQEKENILA